MEYIRPWKLATLALGIGILILGAFYYQLRDWDIMLSILMGIMTYITAPKAVHAFLHPTFMGISGSLAWWIITVDVSYVMYNSFMGNAEYIVREENFFASSCLYWICGIVWAYNGSLKELRNEAPSNL